MPYHIHIDRWLEKAMEDFYTLFVKAWIPFNAWYNRDIAPETNNGTDKECINYICKNDNTYKNKILAFLRGNTREDLRFQQEMVDLHMALLNHPIPDAAHPITFSTTTIYDNSHPVEHGDYYSISYKIERKVKASGCGYDYEVKVNEKGNGPLKFNVILNKWKMEDLEGHPDFGQFSEAIKNKLKHAFKTVDIKAPTDAIVKPVIRKGVESRPPHSKMYGKEEKAYFIDDDDKLAQVLIQLMYKLRCQIFHGELDPTIQNMEVYEHAYRIQSMIIKELN